MHDDRSWAESVPSVSENRVRYIVFFLFLTLIILVYLAKAPMPKSAPSDDLFVGTTDTRNNAKSGRSRLADMLDAGKGTGSGSANQGTQGNQSGSLNVAAPNPTEGVSLPPPTRRTSLPMPTLLTNRGSGSSNSSSRFGNNLGNNKGRKDISNVTFEDLMAKTGFSKSSTMASSMTQSINLPKDLPGLLRVIGAYRRKKEISTLGLIAGKQRYSNQARALALGALRNFNNAREATDVLTSIIESPDEPFFVREAALSSLLHIDGQAFEEFYARLTLSQIKAPVPDMRVCELLVLAAYGDAIMYRGRSLKKLLPRLEALGNQSEIAQALASFKLRLPGAKAHPTDIARYRVSQNVTVLSNFIAYLRQRSLFDEEARKSLNEFATRHSIPLVRQMAKSALGKS